MVNVTNYWDVLCNQCILLLENLCHLTGLSYGFINVLFFCILGPLGTICFMGSTATAVYGKSNAVRKNLTLTFFLIGILCVVAILLPCLWAVFTL